MKKNIYILLLIFFNIVHANESGKTVIAVGEAGVEKMNISFKFAPRYQELIKSDKEFASSIIKILNNDFLFYKKQFKVLKTKSDLIEKSINYSSWKTKNFSYIVSLDLKRIDSTLSLNINVFDIDNEKVLFSMNSFVITDQLRRVAHNMANKIYHSITGKESIFETRIVFVSDNNDKQKKHIKELYIMDFDGNNVERLTNHQGLVISPAISNNQDKVVYSFISGKNKNRRVNLYLLDLVTKKSSLISSLKGLNTGAVFMPDDKDILLTLSHTGNAEIFKMNLSTKSLTRVTRHFAPDVDPSVNHNGNLMTFLSGRAGKAEIYTADPNSIEKNVKRISFVGKFNATPRFSPDGREIAFSSWLDNRFDIFKINYDGTGLSRLTKDFGSNEDPTFSNDGNFIAFSSQRVISKYKAVQNIYIMDVDGEILGKITNNFGNCITPRWSKLSNIGEYAKNKDTSQ